MTVFRWIIDDVGERLDIFLANQDEPPTSRSQVKKRLDAGEVTVNGKSVKAGYLLREGDQVVWCFTPPKTANLAPQNIPLKILFENEHLAVVDKPAGMVVHPSPGHPDNTLVNALLYHFDSLPSVGGVLRPGIVHRIDKDTSGALVVTKDDDTHIFLAQLFRQHNIQRVYHAIVAGKQLPDSGTFDTYHTRAPNNRLRYTGQVEGKRRAVTHFRVLERFSKNNDSAQLIECTLETGRTHQIRMHFFEANCPLLGDALYGTKASFPSPIIQRQALHARTLGFTLSDGTVVDTVAEYPADFAQALEDLRAGKAWR